MARGGDRTLPGVRHRGRRRPGAAAYRDRAETAVHGRRADPPTGPAGVAGHLRRAAAGGRAGAAPGDRVTSRRARAVHRGRRGRRVRTARAIPVARPDRRHPGGPAARPAEPGRRDPRLAAAGPRRGDADPAPRARRRAEDGGQDHRGCRGPHRPGQCGAAAAAGDRPGPRLPERRGSGRAAAHRRRPVHPRHPAGRAVACSKPPGTGQGTDPAAPMPRCPPPCPPAPR